MMGKCVQLNNKNLHWQAPHLLPPLLEECDVGRQVARKTCIQPCGALKHVSGILQTEAIVKLVRHCSGQDHPGCLAVSVQQVHHLVNLLADSCCLHCQHVAYITVTANAFQCKPSSSETQGARRHPPLCQPSSCQLAPGQIAHQIECTPDEG